MATATTISFKNFNPYSIESISGYLEYADIPIITSTLKILLPTIFPTLKSRCFFFAATTDVINSGNDVPQATIVRLTILSEIPIEVAVTTALSTVSVASN